MPECWDGIAWDAAKRKTALISVGVGVFLPNPQALADLAKEKPPPEGRQRKSEISMEAES